MTETQPADRKDGYIGLSMLVISGAVAGASGLMYYTRSDGLPLIAGGAAFGLIGFLMVRDTIEYYYDQSVQHQREAVHLRRFKSFAEMLCSQNSADSQTVEFVVSGEDEVEMRPAGNDDTTTEGDTQ